MRKTLLVIFVFTACLKAMAVTDRLATAIATVESGVDDRAVGDGGKALGRYQIHKAAVTDFNRANKASFKHTDMRDPVKARQVLDWYLGHYGKGKSDIAKARIHNGGPTGDRKTATLGYAAKIKEIL